MVIRTIHNTEIAQEIKSDKRIIKYKIGSIIFEYQEKIEFHLVHRAVNFNGRRNFGVQIGHICTFGCTEEALVLELDHRRKKV